MSPSGEFVPIHVWCINLLCVYLYLHVCFYAQSLKQQSAAGHFQKIQFARTNLLHIINGEANNNLFYYSYCQ